MSNFIRLMSAMREQMHATISRSDALKALVWPIGLMVSALVGLVWAGASTWLLILFSVLLALSVLLYGGAYIYFLLNDPDALRSESYTLNKMAIEHGLYGDSGIGLIEPDKKPDGSQLLIDVSASTETADDPEADQ
jgi:hypothetical protein